MKLASLLLVGILFAATPAGADVWRREAPRVVAESVVDGVRRVNIAVPPRAGRDELSVTLVCPDGTQRPAEEVPVYDGMAVVPVSVCGGADATTAVMPVRRAATRCMAKVDWFHTPIPPLGQVRPAAAAKTATVKQGCECGGFPSLPAGLLLFGALPFALSYGAVSFLRRRG